MWGIGLVDKGELILEILHEDNQIIVVKKEQNIPSQADNSQDKDLLSLVKEYIKQKYQKPGNVFVGLVHRLDRPTGGVMVFAKTSKAASRLAEQVVSGTFEKKYLAVLVGHPKEKHARLVHYLRKNERENIVEVVPALTEGAKRAELEYTVLDTKGNYSLVEIKLFTGRSHQIRVQMKAIGCPVYGDQKYGGPSMKKANLNLFAFELKFVHPVSKEKLVFRAYPPEDKPAWKLFKLDPFLLISKSQD